MRHLLAMLAISAFSLNACSDVPSIRDNLGSGDEPDPGPISARESYFIEVRGKQFSIDSDGSVDVWTNVIAEVAPDRVVYSRRYWVKLGDAEAPEKELETLDRKQLSESEYQQLTKQIEAYLSANGEILTPIGCSLAIGGRSRAIVSVGEAFWEADSHFIYPYRCENDSGNIIKEDLNTVLASLPRLEGLQGYKIE